MENKSVTFLASGTINPNTEIQAAAVRPWKNCFTSTQPSDIEYWIRYSFSYFGGGGGGGF